MLADLSGFVLSMTTETITLQRFNRDTYATNGVKNSRTFTTTSGLKVNTQPIQGADLKRLPEGYSASEGVTVFCATELKMRDRITLSRGGDFEVSHVEAWGTAGNFWKAVAKRLQAGAES
jgi:hypothetical protein